MTSIKKELRTNSKLKFDWEKWKKMAYNHPLIIFITIWFIGAGMGYSVVSFLLMQDVLPYVKKERYDELQKENSKNLQSIERLKNTALNQSTLLDTTQSSNSTIKQEQNGTGDNVGRDKIVNNPR